MDNAKKFGYSFKIIKGYTFKKSKIFEGFIDKLYNLRLNYPKSDPMNYIAKLFMNSLYGRFGMNDVFNEIRIVNQEELDKLTSDNNTSIIKDIINLDEDYLIQLEKNEMQELNSLIDNLSESHNINIAVASFVTSYARIFMSQFKNKKDIKFFYTDTDSIIVTLESKVPQELIDNKLLGKLKLEQTIIKAIFLAPKLYCFLNKESELITKTRGLSHDIQVNLQDFENLLFKDSEIIKHQEK
jgi:DNA polymerase elongation subunit (family B)